MKSLLYKFLFILFISVLCATAHSTNTDDTTLAKQEAWIQSLLREQSISIKDSDYLFYCTGHHGIIWSLIASGHSGISLYNGTTRKIEHYDYSIPDSLSFINDNIKTISWGFDSLLNSAQLLAPHKNTPHKNTTYNPIYNQLYIKKMEI